MFALQSRDSLDTPVCEITSSFSTAYQLRTVGVFAEVCAAQGVKSWGTRTRT